MEKNLFWITLVVVVVMLVFIGALRAWLFSPLPALIVGGLIGRYLIPHCKHR